MEWAFFTRTQLGEYDTALYELERCWGNKPSNPIAHGAETRPATDRVIKSIDDVHAAMKHFVAELAASGVISIATHISSEIVFSDVSDERMAAALARRDQAGPEERDIYASYVHEAFLTALEPHAGEIVFQPSFAAEPLRTLCRELPNMALAGYWWHNFFPGAMRQVMEERLDMLAINKQAGFFSDAYCIEWAYAKSVMVRNQLAQVMAQKVAQGQYSQDQAVEIAHAILFDTPQTLLGMTPAKIEQ